MLLVLAVLAHDVKSVTAANMALNGGACFLDLQGTIDKCMMVSCFAGGRLETDTQSYTHLDIRHRGPVSLRKRRKKKSHKSALSHSLEVEAATTPLTVREPFSHRTLGASVKLKESLDASPLQFP